MQIVTTFDPSASTTGTFNLVLPGNRGKVLVYNESNINLTLTFSNQDTTYIPAWMAMVYCVHDLPSPVVTWTQLQQLAAASSPISQVVIETYDPGEALAGVYPAALVRQTNIGNAVNTVSGTSASIQNDGNTGGTTIIESTPSGAGASTWQADNSGNLTVKGNNAGTLTALLQLIAGASPAVKIAAASIVAEVLGGLKVDGTFESAGAATCDSTLAVTGTSTFTGAITGTNTSNALVSSILRGTTNLPLGTLGISASADIIDASGDNTYVKSRNLGNIIMQAPNGTSTWQFDNSGANFSCVGGGGINFNIGRIKDINNGSALSGTINHGLSGTPGAVLATCNSSGSSATVGASNYTSTQFTLTIGGGLNGRWVAYR